MKYIIMADGKGTRWNNHNGHPKHLCRVNNETLVERIVRLLKENNIENIIISSHNKELEYEGATRYEPISNNEEIDRFVYELINEEITYLYGDTFYEEETIKQIINTKTNDILFFGNEKSIVAIKVINFEEFKQYIDYIKNNNIIGKGWTIYQLKNNLPLGSKTKKDNFIVVSNKNINVDGPEDYKNLIDLIENNKNNA